MDLLNLKVRMLYDSFESSLEYAIQHDKAVKQKTLQK